MRKIILILSCLIFFPVYSKVDPPNYNFSLDSFSPFYPGAKLVDIQKAHGKGSLMEESSSVKTYRFSISKKRYVFPIFIQVKEDRVIDFYVRLPSYFLHNVFHQSLINRYGKQDKYIKKENSAVYIWNNAKNMKIIYSGTCTITCFPMYLSVWPKDKSLEAPSILEKLSTKN